MSTSGMYRNWSTFIVDFWETRRAKNKSPSGLASLSKAVAAETIGDGIDPVCAGQRPAHQEAVPPADVRQTIRASPAHPLPAPQPLGVGNAARLWDGSCSGQPAQAATGRQSGPRAGEKDVEWAERWGGRDAEAATLHCLAGEPGLPFDLSWALSDPKNGESVHHFSREGQRTTLQLRPRSHCYARPERRKHKSV